MAPNFKSSILHRDVVGPYEMEHEYGLIGGNIFHGELSLEQLFHMRPAPGYADYRTPVARPLQRELGHPRGRRRLRHPGLAGRPRRDRRPRRESRRRPQRAADRRPRRAAERGPAVTAPESVRAMLEARSVAVVGASARPGSFGERVVTEVAAQPVRARRSTW